MPKTLVFGNGQTLCLLDKYARMRDFYFPFVGLENHIGGKLIHRIGVFVENQFSWLDDGRWEITQTMNEGWIATTRAERKDFGVIITFTDALYNEKNIFLRSITVENTLDRDRDVKLFFNQQFELYRSERGDTAYYDPRDQVVIHYEGQRVFLIHARSGDSPFEDYTTGIFQLEGKEGTYRDAEDGRLEKNPIEHGTVDSTIGITVKSKAHAQVKLSYWMTVGLSIEEAKELHQSVLERSADSMIETTHDFWNAWGSRHPHRFYGLSEGAIELFRKSQFYLRSHADNNGAIIASGDSDMLQSGRDTYAYVWPRDAAFAALALDWIGDRHMARKFFEFAAKTMKPEGYFMHRNRSDGSLGSSWHPWILDGRIELPIQEDETALILWALGEHYEVTKDIEFIESLYNTLILPAANFLLSYRDPYSGLPKPSYNLWEEKWGVHTFTVASVYGGLRAAAMFSALLGKTRNEHNFRHAADEVSRALLEHAWNAELGAFYKTISVDEKGMITVYDQTIDASSAYGVFIFGVLPAGDDRMVRAMKVTEEHLVNRTQVGGLARYEHDNYFRVSPEGPGNPWIITSLWLAQYQIATASTDKDLDKVREWLNWCVRMAASTGVLPEQMNPYTKEHLSTAPLTWSHAEYIRTILMYLNKLELLKIIPSEHVFVRT